ncbi:divergent serine/threonine protein kinase [Tokyovirus A1]|uniref:divergent serine/threonine protein kinase n=1 Tax=Tokyovirus A1 TaxID=1826170 RepID=UPI0007A97944|nr:divergent serine/threonine protein kinase [Tokyovirus A1]BAU80172.1 divergent serine/threonine protein kinase [Tokyovirus A1]
MEQDKCDLELDTCFEDLDLSLNDSKKALGALFRLFPVILNVETKRDWLFANLVQPFVVRSRGFCKKDEVSFETQGAGGFSIAGFPTTSGKKFRLKQISFNHEGGWRVYWVPAFAKRTHKARAQPLICNMQQKTLVLTDPLYEAIVSSFLSNLFDLGVLPCFSKVFGTEFCESEQRKYTATVLMESSGESFRKLVRTKGGISGFSVGDYLAFFALLFRDLETAKSLIGFYHADLHPDNVLVKSVGSPTTDEKGAELYDGKPWAEAEFIVEELPTGNFFVIQNNSKIPKVIDYGLTVVRFSKSSGALYPELKRRDFAVSNEAKIYEMANRCKESLLDEQGLKNFEAIFFLLNILFDCEKISLGMYPGVVLDGGLYDATKATLLAFGINENSIKRAFAKKAEAVRRASTPEEAQRIWFNERDVGNSSLKTSTEAVSSLVPSVNFRGRTFHVFTKKLERPSEAQLSAILDSPSTIVVPHVPNARVQSSNTETKFRSEILRYSKECVEGKSTELFGEGYIVDKNRKKECAIKLVESLNNDQEFLLPKITSLSPSLAQVVPFARKEFETYGSEVCSIFSRPLFPNIQTEISDIFVYKQYQRLLNFKSPSEKLWGRPMRTVRCSFVGLSRRARCSLSTGKRLQQRITKNVLDGSAALCVNGGYFVVQQNIANSLTPGLKGKEYSPIGYYFDGTSKSGTTLPVPPPYRDWFVAVTVKGGKLGMERLPEFEKKHKLRSVPFRVLTEGRETLEFSQTVIAESRNDIYDQCFCSGPILIWGGKRVFDENTMLNSEFSLQDGRKYKVFDAAKNTKMWFSEQGETQFPYGQRHSANFQIHNIMVLLKDGSFGFFFFEGRGYDALGTDRVQVAKAIELFFGGNVLHAVSLDGGFSANAVVTKEGDAPRWLLPDPEKRKLGVSMLFENS